MLASGYVALHDEREVGGVGRGGERVEVVRAHKEVVQQCGIGPDLWKRESVSLSTQGRIAQEERQENDPPSSRISTVISRNAASFASAPSPSRPDCTRSSTSALYSARPDRICRWSAARASARTGASRVADASEARAAERAESARGSTRCLGRGAATIGACALRMAVSDGPSRRAVQELTR